MEALEQIKHKMDSTVGLLNIVSTMKTLSAASIHQYIKAVNSLEKYQHTVELGLQVVLREHKPTTTTHDQVKGCAAIVVFGSDHGLCGKFNEEVTQYAVKKISARRKGSDTKLLVIGLRAADLLQRAGLHVTKTLNLPSTAKQISSLVQEVLLITDQWRDEAGLDQLDLIHNGKQGLSGYKATSIKLLPFDMKRFDYLQQEPWISRSLPTYTMNRTELLSCLIRQLLFISLYRACAESQASEHTSRLESMRASEINLNERRDQLKAHYRKARQEAITNEIIAVVAGFDASLPCPGVSDEY